MNFTELKQNLESENRKLQDLYLEVPKGSDEIVDLRLRFDAVNLKIEILSRQLSIIYQQQSIEQIEKQLVLNTQQEEAV
jgi:hypothetical protein